jgi:hypothetical protein
MRHYPPFTCYTSPVIAYPSLLIFCSPPPLLTPLPRRLQTANERANKQSTHHRLTSTFAMPAPSASQQKAQANEVANVLQIDSKTAAKLLAKSGWSTSVAINGYVHTLLS